MEIEIKWRPLSDLENEWPNLNLVLLCAHFFFHFDLKATSCE